MICIKKRRSRRQGGNDYEWTGSTKESGEEKTIFYIMKDKEIFGAKQEDGSAIHFIYESDGRLINSAQIVGNITDENMLRLLETVEGFGKLVHSIGVSVETDNPKEEMEFIFQMYGKKISTEAEPICDAA